MSLKDGTNSELTPVPLDNAISCLYDGAGTKDNSNIRVHFLHSAPNSDTEHELDPGIGIRTRRSKQITNASRKSTRTGKKKNNLHSTQL